MRRAASIVLVVLTSLVLTAVPAGAHAEIRESDPPADGIAPTGLDQLSITFISMDPAAPFEVSVVGPDGTDRVNGAATVQETTPMGTTVIVPVTPLDDGVYQVGWRAMSTDGDGLASDSFQFTVQPSSGGGIGVWLIGIVALAVPALILLRPGRRRRTR